MSEEFKNLFYEKLDLLELSFKEQSDFLISITNYLNHGRSEEINGRTIDYVSERLDKLLEFLYALDFDNREVVHIITLYPGIFNGINSLYEKYLFLGIVENLDNTVRKNKLYNKPKDFMVGLGKMYARYKLIIDSGYNNVTWNSLVHASDREFARIFIPGSHKKSYHMFSNELGVLDYLANVDIRELNIEKYKELPVNEELVRKYESKGKKH